MGTKQDGNTIGISRRNRVLRIGASVAVIGSLVGLAYNSNRDTPADSNEPGSLKIGQTAVQIAEIVDANRFESGLYRNIRFERTETDIHYDTYQFDRACPVIEATSAQDASSPSGMTITAKFFHKEMFGDLHPTDISDVSIVRTGSDDGFTVTLHKGPHGWSYNQKVPTGSGMIEQGYSLADAGNGQSLSITELTTALTAVGNRFMTATTTPDCGPALSEITPR